jgi:hypothetical protein
MGYNKIAPEDESNKKVEIPTGPVITERERNPDRADSGKKVLPGVERFRLNTRFVIRNH